MTHSASAAQPLPANASQTPTASALASAERRLKLVIETAPVALLITDPMGEVLAANKAALKLFGTERLSDILKKYLNKLVAVEDRERVSAFVKQVCEGAPGSLQFAVVGADGSRHVFETSAVPLQREPGTPTAFLSATWEASQSQPAQSAAHGLVEAERDAAKEALREAQARLAQLETDGEAARESLQRMQLLEAERDAVKEELQQVLGRLQHVEAERDADKDALHRIEFLEAEREAAKEALHHAETANRTIADDLARHQEKLAEALAFQDRLRQVEAEFDTIKGSLQEADTANQQLTDNLALHREAAAEAASTAQARIDEVRAEHDQTRAALHDATARNETLTADAVSQQQRHADAMRDAEDRVRALEDGGKELGRTIHQLSEERNELADQLRTARDRHGALQARVDALEQAVTDARAQADASAADARNEQERLQQALSAEQAKAEDFLAERAQWQQELSALFADASGRIGALLNGSRDSTRDARQDAPGNGHQTFTSAVVTVVESSEVEDDSWRF